MSLRSLSPTTGIMLARVAIAALIASGCNSGNREAMRLRESCEPGNATACNDFAIKLQK